MTIDEKLSALRKQMKSDNIDAYLITGTDYHQSEYVAPFFRTREFISGFSGSAGTVIVTKDKALLWVDSRYFIQGAEQIKGSSYILMKQDFEDTPDPYTFIETELKKGESLGVDGKTISIERFSILKERYSKLGIELVSSPDYLEPIWTDRPAFPFSPVSDFPIEFAGVSREDKIATIRKEFISKGAKATLIASLDDIAWTLNLRANDVPSCPVFVSFLYINENEAILFTDEKRFSKELYEAVSKSVAIKPYLEVYNLPEELCYFDPNRISQSLIKLISPSSVKGLDISSSLKACKNKVELEGMRRAHYEDGIAYCNFRAKLEKEKSLDEIAVSTLFEKERERRPGYVEPSFGAISGFGPHGAMCHYSAKPETNAKIDCDSLLVLDTGGHYLCGTTDLTRTLLFGKATSDQKKDYTLVLKGHLALASCWFIEGTRGVQLDILAKQFLFQAGESFYHGTGHGVGCRLNVHEGPQNISSRLVDVPLKEGMVVSDEPGLYKEGRYGIRIENLIAVTKAAKTEFGQFYSFETLSMVPYEKELFDYNLLTDIEIKQINSYHKWVYEEFKDKVDKESLAWLEKATSPIEK